MTYKDKVVWITGASSGIGEALVYAFDNKKAKLIISSRNKTELERVKGNCDNTDCILVLPLDLANHDTMKEKVDMALDKFGHVDILVNNGGVSQRALIKDTKLDVDKKIMDINYFGTIALTKALLPEMLKKKSGHIVVISSLTGKFSTPLRSAYAASKHALHGFFDALRVEVWKDNVKVLIVCPGFIKTNVSINALVGNGLAHNKMDPAAESGMEPSVLAKKILKAIKKNKEEILVGSTEILGVYLKRYTPKLFSKIIKNKKVT